MQRADSGVRLDRNAGVCQRDLSWTDGRWQSGRDWGRGNGAGISSAGVGRAGIKRRRREHGTDQAP
eukprot:1247932-Rhodomonas_salina.1